MTDMLGPSPMHSKYSSYVYDGFCIWRTNFPGPIESIISKFACNIYLPALWDHSNLIMLYQMKFWIPTEGLPRIFQQYSASKEWVKIACHSQAQGKWVPETHTSKGKRIFKCIYSNRRYHKMHRCARLDTVIMLSSPERKHAFPYCCSPCKKINKRKVIFILGWYINYKKHKLPLGRLDWWLKVPFEALESGKEINFLFPRPHRESNSGCLCHRQPTKPLDRMHITKWPSLAGLRVLHHTTKAFSILKL